MSRKVTKEEQREREECFAIFATGGNMSPAKLGMALRALGYNPSEATVQNILKDIGTPSSINFDTFKIILSKDLPGADSPEEIREAFGIFDRDNNGTISAQELRHMLVTSGECLTEEEVDMMMKDTDVDQDGHIQYEQFVQILAQK